MKNGRTLVVSGLGLLLCLAAIADAQESTSKARPNVPLLDAKALADPKKDEAAAALLESAHQGQRMPESVRMLITILRNSPLAAGEGWFGPAQKRYTWEWLAHRYGKASAELEKLIGAKPLVLIFGSFTCGRFRSQYAAVEELKQRYTVTKGKQEFDIDLKE